jgi:hypothetical protein
MANVLADAGAVSRNAALLADILQRAHKDRDLMAFLTLVDVEGIAPSDAANTLGFGAVRTANVKRRYYSLKESIAEKLANLRPADVRDAVRQISASSTSSTLDLNLPPAVATSARAETDRPKTLRTFSKGERPVWPQPGGSLTPSFVRQSPSGVRIRELSPSDVLSNSADTTSHSNPYSRRTHLVPTQPNPEFKPDSTYETTHSKEHLESQAEAMKLRTDREALEAREIADVEQLSDSDLELEVNRLAADDGDTPLGDTQQRDPVTGRWGPDQDQITGKSSGPTSACRRAAYRVEVAKKTRDAAEREHSQKRSSKTELAVEAAQLELDTSALIAGNLMRRLVLVREQVAYRAKRDGAKKLPGFDKEIIGHLAGALAGVAKLEEFCNKNGIDYNAQVRTLLFSSVENGTVRNNLLNALHILKMANTTCIQLSRKGIADLL